MDRQIGHEGLTQVLARYLHDNTYARQSTQKNPGGALFCARSVPLQHAERRASLGRREGEVDRGEVVGVEYEIERASIVAYMVGRRRLRYDDHAVLAQQPGERT